MMYLYTQVSVKNHILMLLTLYGTRVIAEVTYLMVKNSNEIQRQHIYLFLYRLPLNLIFDYLSVYTLSRTWRTHSYNKHRL